MAAVLTPRPSVLELSSARPVPAEAPWNSPVPARPALTVVEGGRSDGALARRRRSALRLVATVGAGLALAVVVALGATGALFVLGADAAAPGPASPTVALDPVGAGPSTTPASTVVVVQRGDTLWNIARRLQPSGDVRPLVDALADRAGGASLDVGQRLDVTGLVD